MGSVVGVDPGKKGALTFIDTETCELHVYDMPLNYPNKLDNKPGKQLLNIADAEVDPVEIQECIRRHSATYAALENVWAFGNDGKVGAFSFGYAFGTVATALACNSVRTRKVTPQVWKKNMRCPTDKSGAIDRAIELIPSSELILGRLKDDGRAESIMIAMYGCFYYGFELEDELIVRTINGVSVADAAAKTKSRRR